MLLKPKMKQNLPRGNRLKTGLVNRATSVQGLPDCDCQLFSFLFLENQTSPGQKLGRADHPLGQASAQEVERWTCKLKSHPAGSIAGFVLDSPESSFENIQLVCLLSVWILDPVKFDLNFFEIFAWPHWQF